MSGRVTFSNPSDERKSMNSFSVLYLYLNSSAHLNICASFNPVSCLIPSTFAARKHNSGVQESMTRFRQAMLASGNRDISSDLLVKHK
jgi:hypothetical protein